MHALMHGHTWFGAVASFLGMWIVMMVPMMLPSAIPMLARYRRAVDDTGNSRPWALTVLVVAGYFLVWAVIGLGVFPLVVALTTIEMHQPAMAGAVPFIVGAVVAIAGALQFTASKRRLLTCCREAAVRGDPRRFNAGTAWRHGLHLGLLCVCCCANLMAILIVIGVMDLRVMAVVTAAITAERLSPAGERVAGIIGGAVVAAGLFLIARAAG